MSYALVPDGYTLKKVTKAQKEAVDKFYRSQNIDSFLDGQASGELVKAATIVVTPIVLGALAKQLIDLAKKEGISLTNVEELKALALRLNPITLPIDIALSLAAKATGRQDIEKELREQLPIF
tara:strand:+ start:381 stop:749 length:369 start_codon:yes stop_codon:yes gene_type:complete